MIWFLLLYILPLFLSVVIGYKLSKKEGETKREFLKGVLIMLIPIINIIFLMAICFVSIKDSRFWQKFEEYLDEEL